MKTPRHGSGGEAGNGAVDRRASLSGFSLVELLVVIGILAVLALLVLPVFTKMAERRRSLQCLEKLRNLGVVMNLYRAERNQRMWKFTSTDQGGEGQIPPVRIFYRYGLISHASEMCCPKATTEAEGAWKTGGTGTPEYNNNIGEQYVSYTVNGCAFFQSTPYNMSTQPLRSFLQFEGNEARTPLFMDGTFFQLNDNTWRKEQRFERLALRHDNKCHVLFLDGHVESLDRRGLELLDPYGGYNQSWMRNFGYQ